MKRRRKPCANGTDVGLASEKLYTPEVLALATGLSAWPWDDSLPLKGTARSRSCGSSLELGLGLDAIGRIKRLGLRAHACAIGQAAAAIFANGAMGKDSQAIVLSRDGLANWLGGDGDLPDWPGIAVLSAARQVPGRHGAIMLAWNAALDAFPSG